MNLQILPCVALLLVTMPSPRVGAQAPRPFASLVEAPPLDLPGEVDSNSPVVWSMQRGQRLVHITTSTAGQPSVASGARITRVVGASPVEFSSHPGHGVWMEAIVADDQGTWYGYYHNEIPADVCDRPDLVIPRIGAARSTDHGTTWEDLGVILEGPVGGESCGTANTYFAGGVGDFSAVLDPNATNLYIFFSQYSASAAAQGTAAARLSWSARDHPVGGIDVWVNGAWLPASSTLVGSEEDLRLVWRYPSGTPLVVPERPWHDADPVTNAFWGPSVHWNTALQQYVMLLNRTQDETFAQEGIYVSFAPSLDDPTRWSIPQRLLAGGRWYPQVIGLEIGEGTDKLAGGVARFFMGGRSTHLIRFGIR